MTATATRAAETWAHILAQPDGYPMGVAADWLQEHTDHDGSDEAKAEACAAVEAVAQAHLDARPDDHRARRLLGEWLQWHGDGRGEGLRALAACKRLTSGHWVTNSVAQRRHFGCWLPSDWWLEVSLIWKAAGSPKYTRRAAEDAASLAFARLPAGRRAQLLKGEM